MSIVPTKFSINNSRKNTIGIERDFDMWILNIDYLLKRFLAN